MGYTLVSEDLRPLVSQVWLQAQPLNDLSCDTNTSHGLLDD